MSVHSYANEKQIYVLVNYHFERSIDIRDLNFSSKICFRRFFGYTQVKRKFDFVDYVKMCPLYMKLEFSVNFFNSISPILQIICIVGQNESVRRQISLKKKKNLKT